MEIYKNSYDEEIDTLKESIQEQYDKLYARLFKMKQEESADAQLLGYQLIQEFLIDYESVISEINYLEFACHTW